MSESKLLMSRKQLAVMCHDDPDAIRLMERLTKVAAAFEGYLPDNLPYVTDADLESNVPELGSNSSGYWAKFPSGLMICRCDPSASVPTGNVVNLPAEYIAAPTVLNTQYATNSSSQVQYRVQSVYNITTTSFVMGYITGGGNFIWAAIGRWK